VFDETEIVVPIYNEAATVDPLIERLRRACPAARLVFVDNASTDGTLERLAAHPDVQVVRHPRNLGYGRSIRDGIAVCRRTNVVVIDADLEYQPEDVPAIVAALATSPVVHGSRFLGAEGARVMRGTRRLGNATVTALFNALFGQRLTDLYTGVRGYRRAAVPLERLTRDGFEFVLEASAHFARAGVRIVEVPVRYVVRTAGRSKMRHVREFVKFAWCLAVLRLRGG
jgi:glycosyltransferase involved in cell wall biosynthesis